MKEHPGVACDQEISISCEDKGFKLLISNDKFPSESIFPTFSGLITHLAFRWQLLESGRGHELEVKVRKPKRTPKIHYGDARLSSGSSICKSVYVTTTFMRQEVTCGQCLRRLEGSRMSVNP